MVDLRLPKGNYVPREKLSPEAGQVTKPWRSVGGPPKGETGLAQTKFSVVAARPNVGHVVRTTGGQTRTHEGDPWPAACWPSGGDQKNGLFTSI